MADEGDHNGDELEEIVTLGEFFDEMDEDEEKLATVVMGAADSEEICTYDKGYLTRQAVFVCQTCASLPLGPAGVCYHCANVCHEGHTILELYTKRHFRCDCGNSKFPTNECKLQPNKVPSNVENKYNQNFFGTYCTCQRPYPDEEISDEMFTCCLCEDWFHSSHLPNFPSDSDFEDLVCPSCMSKHTFLQTYAKSLSTPTDVDIVTVSPPTTSSDCSDSKRPRLSTSPCKLNQLQKSTSLSSQSSSDKDKTSGAVAASFWPENWRDTILCACDKCKDMYKEEGVDFLMVPEDRVSVYAEKGRQRMQEMDSKATDDLSKTFNQLPRPVAIEVASKLAAFKEDMAGFFASIKDSNKVITADEVQKFFAAQKRKRGMD